MDILTISLQAQLPLSVASTAMILVFMPSQHHSVRLANQGPASVHFLERYDTKGSVCLVSIIFPNTVSRNPLTTDYRPDCITTMCCVRFEYRRQRIALVTPVDPVIWASTRLAPDHPHICRTESQQPYTTPSSFSVSFKGCHHHWHVVFDDQLHCESLSLPFSPTF